MFLDEQSISVLPVHRSSSYSGNYVTIFVIEFDLKLIKHFVKFTNLIIFFVESSAINVIASVYQRNEITILKMETFGTFGTFGIFGISVLIEFALIYEIDNFFFRELTFF